MGKIIRINVTASVYFYGKDLPDFTELADSVSEEILLGNYETQCTYVTKPDGLLKQVLDSCPYGPSGDLKTIREWLETPDA